MSKLSIAVGGIWLASSHGDIGRACLGLSAAILLAGLAPRPAMAAHATDVVETTSGPVRGVSENDVHKFLGIRYAASPAGANRWLPPQPPVHAKRVIDATMPGSPCAQPAGPYSVPSTSEDCLFLNVTTPAFAGRYDSLPVLIWIHGGSLFQGAGASYDPTAMVERGDIIVVTINGCATISAPLAAIRSG